ncbi:MAG TPA: hypothetical protein DEB09_01005 [Candidatus Magasanikbacteria bacterium]|nr:hypothetical protein [Candidatus Magasanikbacteria bacterium]
MSKKESLKILEESIRKYAPVVAEFFDCNDSIYDYSKKIYQFESDPVYLERQKYFRRALGDEVQRLFKKNIVLPENLALNIVDHHAILNHPLLMATNIVSNMYRLLGREGESPNPIVVLTSSIVPPNNFFNKKGILFHDKKISLFPNKMIHQAACFMQTHDFKFVDKLKALGKWGEFDEEEQFFLSKIEDGITKEQFSSADNFCDQVSLIDQHLWKLLFSSDIREKIPELLYIPEEKIFTKIFTDIINSDNFVSRVIFDKVFQKLILAKFDGLIGCWDTKNNKGTHFFWFKNENLEPVRLLLQGDFLCTVDNVKKIPLQKNSLIEEMNKGNIVADMFLIYSYILFWCGVEPLVGHGSCNYLTNMKNAWLEVVQEIGDTAEYERLLKINTKKLIAGAIMTYARDKENKIVNQYAMDVICSGGLNNQYLNNLSQMSYKDLLRPALLEIYDSYVPIDKKVNLDLSASDMINQPFDWI